MSIDPLLDFYPRPHMEGDVSPFSGQVENGIFLPTPSHGGRPSCLLQDSCVTLFLPTPSHGGRPQQNWIIIHQLDISTHALTWRATIHFSGDAAQDFGFLPTPSHGGRPVCACVQFCAQNFYPRPHMEGDRFCLRRGRVARNFYPRPHMEGDARPGKGILPADHFYPRPHMEGDVFYVVRFCGRG